MLSHDTGARGMNDGVINGCIGLVVLRGTIADEHCRSRLRLRNVRKLPDDGHHEELALARVRCQQRLDATLQFRIAATGRRQEVLASRLIVDIEGRLKEFEFIHREDHP